MKQVKQSIAIILFLLAACLADSFGQDYKSIKTEYAKKNIKSGNYDVYKTDYSSHEIEYLSDKSQVLFIGQNDNRVTTDKMIYEKNDGGIETEAYSAYFNTIDKQCTLVTSKASLVAMWVIFYANNGNEYSIKYYVKL
jgi:hypothetical protein